jgi:parallel beta-helix repeat protein
MNIQTQHIALGLIAAVGIAMVTLAGCASPVAPAEVGSGGAAAGGGTVRVALGGANIRTLMPSMPEFTKYDLLFTSRAGAAVSVTDVRLDTDTIDVTLDAGNWTLELTAYTNLTGNGDVRAAIGTVDFDLTRSEQKTVHITVSPITMTGGANGVFQYTISYPHNASGALVLTDRNGDSREIPLNTGGSATGSLSLPPDMYDLTIILTQAVAGVDPSRWPLAGTYAATHIYPGLVTEAAGYAFTFEARHFTDGVYLAGTVELSAAHNLTVTEVKVAAYSDEACVTRIPGGEAAISAPDVGVGVPWLIGMPFSAVGPDVWLKVTVKSGAQTVAVERFRQTDIPRNGRAGIALALSAWFPYYYVSETGDDSNNGSAAHPFASVQRAVSAVAARYAADGPSGERAVIVITGAITDEGAGVTANGMVDISGGAYPPIILQGNYDVIGPHSVDATGKSKRVLHVSGGAAVTLENLMLTGALISGNNDGGSGVYVTDSGSSFTLKNGAISGNTGGNGSGVFVTNNATFTMTGGTISGNTANADGGGVYLWSSNQCVMTGGTISGNTGRNGGGVFLYSGSSRFTMTGGTISGNTANTDGGGVYVYSADNRFEMRGGTISGNSGRNGGGLYDYSGTFTMISGVISGNTARNNKGGGVYVNGGTFTMNDGSVSENTGNGVYVNGSGSSFTMNDGSVSENISDNGGGVFVTGNAKFTMTGGAISENTANADGGGVYLWDSNQFLMTGGSISDNTGRSGGGVFLYSGSSRFTMTGGAISGNMTTDNNNGGGVFVCDAGNTFEMSGGAISGNRTNGNGGGVYVNSGSFMMSSDALIAADNDVYLLTDKVITLTGALTGTAPVATLTLATYISGTRVLADNAFVTATYTKFAVTPHSAIWYVSTDGTLTLKAP